MSEKIELIRGSGNVFTDFDRPNAGLEQARALIAAEIIRALDARGLSTREAERLTGWGMLNFHASAMQKLPVLVLTG